MQIDFNLSESGFQDQCPIVGKITNKKALEIFDQHVMAKGLKRSQKRDQVVRAFLTTQKHVSAEDLCDIVKKNNPEIGYTTVYRSLKLIVDCGLAEMVDFNDGVRRFEKKLGREYHAHFICTKCGDHFEVFDDDIEKLAEKMSKKKGFTPEKHRLEVFGTCRKC